MIGIFDSGFGGLTILKEIRKMLSQYDYLYLGDNARAPYGTRSYDIVYEYTWQAVRYLFDHGCSLVILACNTASAKALRTIQQTRIDPTIQRVLGVIRPTVEAVNRLATARHIGVLATPGTVSSESYVIELQKLNPSFVVTQQACPMWVPLIENGEKDSPATDWFVDKYMNQLFEKDADIDTLVLGCTHYPLIREKIQRYLKRRFVSTPIPSLVSQGEVVAHSLNDYLQRHPEIEVRLEKNGNCQYLTTESADRFSDSARIFLNEEDISALHVEY